MSNARQRLGKHSHDNEYTSNDNRTAISMQQRHKHTSVTIEELLGNDVFCGAALRLYNEDYRPIGMRIERVSGDGSRMIEKRWEERN
jgi:hypothetical protein